MSLFVAQFYRFGAIDCASGYNGVQCVLRFAYAWLKSNEPNR